jgi:soluble lytic murein transglycosylase-like protein
MPRINREGNNVRGLLRQRGVQALLVATAGAQVLASMGGEQPEPVMVSMLPAAAALQPLRLEWAVAPIAVEEVEEAPAERLAAQYRAEGFDVSEKLAAEIEAAAAEFEIEPEVAFGLVRAESSFRNAATSPVGAVGLTQLMPKTAAWMMPGVTRKDLRNTETNLRVGFKYLRYLLDKYEGDTNLALLAYNRGPGTVDKALKRGRNPDNGYADFVMGKKDHGHKLFTR